MMGDFYIDPKLFVKISFVSFAVTTVICINRKLSFARWEIDSLTASLMPFVGQLLGRFLDWSFETVLFEPILAWAGVAIMAIAGIGTLIVKED